MPNRLLNDNKITIRVKPNTSIISSGSTGGISSISNVGGGVGVFKQRTGVIADFKTLVAGSNINLSATTDTIIISSTGSTSGGQAYTGASPTNVAVGALGTGAVISGRTLSQIIQDMLITVFTPVFVAPSVNLTENVNNTQEVGSIIDIIYTANFDRGDINLTTDQSTTRQGDRSGAPNSYSFTGISANTVTSTNNTQTITLIDYEVLQGANNESVEVSYDAGIQPLDSNNNPFGSPLAPGTVSDAAPVITGIYPIFYNTSSIKPVANSSLLNGATKSIITSSGTVTVPFNTSGGQYTWLAIPSSSTNKTVWFVTALSNGAIASSSPTSEKYLRIENISVDSPTGLWTGVNYDFYISEVAGVDTTVQFRNS